VDEGGGLENRYTGNCIVGSNPTPSARLGTKRPVDRNLRACFFGEISKRPPNVPQRVWVTSTSTTFYYIRNFRTYALQFKFEVKQIFYQPFRSLATAAANSSCILGNTWEYRSNVMVTLE
jgi:hypothetical protein